MRINKLGKTSITGRCVEKRTKKDKEINTERPRHMALPVQEHDLIRDWQSCEMVNHNGLRIGMARKDNVKSSVMYYTYKYLNSNIYCLQTCSVMYWTYKSKPNEPCLYLLSVSSLPGAKRTVEDTQAGISTLLYWHTCCCWWHYVLKVGSVVFVIFNYAKVLNNHIFSTATIFFVVKMISIFFSINKK